MKEINVGIQLYSVRDEIQKYGIDEVFRTLSECGCNAVEFAGFYGLSPEEMKKKLEKYGLRPLAAHIKAQEILNTLPYIDALGIKEVYIPSYPVDSLKDCDGYREFVRIVNEIKPVLDGRGVVFGYHNHAREFEGGIDLLDKMSADIPGFKLELDIYWALAGGHKPTELIKKYGNRLSALHIKDMDKKAVPASPNELPNAIIGEGQCGAEDAFNAALGVGVSTFILEVEYYPCDYSEYIKKSCDAINGFLERAN